MQACLAVVVVATGVDPAVASAAVEVGYAVASAVVMGAARVVHSTITFMHLTMDPNSHQAGIVVVGVDTMGVIMQAVTMQNQASKLWFAMWVRGEASDRVTTNIT